MRRAKSSSANRSNGSEMGTSPGRDVQCQDRIASPGPGQSVAIAYDANNNHKKCRCTNRVAEVLERVFLRLSEVCMGRIRKGRTKGCRCMACPHSRRSCSGDARESNAGTFLLHKSMSLLRFLLPRITRLMGWNSIAKLAIQVVQCATKLLGVDLPLGSSSLELPLHGIQFLTKLPHFGGEGGGIALSIEP